MPGDYNYSIGYFSCYPSNWEKNKIWDLMVENEELKIRIFNLEKAQKDIICEIKNLKQLKND